jgi:hypothetical protein
MISQSEDYMAGNGGVAARDRRLLRLGPNDYYGWVTIETFGDSGCHGSSYLILAPHGNYIREVADIPEHSDNGGNCSTDAGCLISFDARMRVEPSKAVAVYPLAITYWGTAPHATLHKTKVLIPFDSGQWTYMNPQIRNWPPSGFEGC